MDLVLGIDGGGTSTRFSAVARKDGSEIWKLVLDEPCKPSVFGEVSAYNAISSGLSVLKREIGETPLVTYAGIAGVTSANDVPLVSKLLSGSSRKFYIGGDIETNYFAVANSGSGLILLAGSGSAIAVFDQYNLVANQSSVAIGARDLLNLVITEANDGRYDSKTKAALFEIFDEEIFDTDKEGIAIAPNHRLRSIKLLTKDYLGESVWRDIQPSFDRAASIWAYKATSAYKKNVDILRNTNAIYLSGGLWHSEYLRDKVIALLRHSIGKQKEYLF
jgi:hypothetical protein